MCGRRSTWRLASRQAARQWCLRRPRTISPHTRSVWRSEIFREGRLETEQTEHGSCFQRTKRAGTSAYVTFGVPWVSKVAGTMIREISVWQRAARFGIQILPDVRSIRGAGIAIMENVVISMVLHMLFEKIVTYAKLWGANVGYFHCVSMVLGNILWGNKWNMYISCVLQSFLWKLLIFHGFYDVCHFSHTEL